MNTFLTEKNVGTIRQYYASILLVQLHQQTQINLVIPPSLRTVARLTEIELIDNDRTRVVYTQLPALPLRSANEKVDSLTLDLVSSNNGRHSANLSAINFSSRSITISHSTLFILPS